MTDDRRTNGGTDDRRTGDRGTDDRRTGDRGTAARQANDRRTDIPVLRTQRLVLRGWRDADRDPFAALNADLTVMELFPATLTRSESDAMVDMILDRWGTGRPSLWAVEVAGGAPFIGFVGLLEPSFSAAFTPCVEVGWRLADEHWGRGYAAEAAAAALTHGFETRGLDEIVSFTSVGHSRSRRVMEKLGMSHDPADDFDHPNLPLDHPINRHVLYRLTA